MTNKQLKKDIAEWQERADAVDIENSDNHEVEELFSEARTLLLRAQQSL